MVCLPALHGLLELEQSQNRTDCQVSIRRMENETVDSSAERSVAVASVVVERSVLVRIREGMDWLVRIRQSK